MATYYEYKCKGCGYTVNANPKGKDMVFMGEVQNYLCSDCKDIVDVIDNDLVTWETAILSRSSGAKQKPHKQRGK